MKGTMAAARGEERWRRDLRDAAAQSRDSDRRAQAARARISPRWPRAGASPSRGGEGAGRRFRSAEGPSRCPPWRGGGVHRLSHPLCLRRSARPFPGNQRPRVSQRAPQAARLLIISLFGNPLQVPGLGCMFEAGCSDTETIEAVAAWSIRHIECGKRATLAKRPRCPLSLIAAPESTGTSLQKSTQETCHQVHSRCQPLLGALYLRLCT